MEKDMRLQEFEKAKQTIEEERRKVQVMLTDLKHKDMEMVMKTASEIQKTEIKLLNQKNKYMGNGKTPKEILTQVSDRFG